MVTTGVETSPYHTTKGSNLDSGTLLVGTKPIKGGVGGDLKVNTIRREGETTTRKVGKTTIEEKVIETRVGETTTLRRAGGTLVRIGEGVARGPLVMEGP